MPYILFPQSQDRATDSDGNPYNGAVWTFFLAGTSTPATVYDADGVSLGTSETADAGGKFVPIYFDEGISYRAVLKNSTASVTIHDLDPASTGGVRTSTVSTTTYTLLATDTQSIIHFTNASAVTVTVPTGLGAGFICGIVQRGTGQVTVSPAVGVTLVHKDSLFATQARYAVLSLIAAAANDFTLSGPTA